MKRAILGVSVILSVMSCATSCAPAGVVTSVSAVNDYGKPKTKICTVSDDGKECGCELIAPKYIKSCHEGDHWSGSECSR